MSRPSPVVRNSSEFLLVAPKVAAVKTDDFTGFFKMPPDALSLPVVPWQDFGNTRIDVVLMRREELPVGLTYRSVCLFSEYVNDHIDRVLPKQECVRPNPQ